ATNVSREPSGPVVGPEIRSITRAPLPRKPRTEAIVFSCAPPTINRVMTCVTRIAAGSAWRRFELREPLPDGLGFLEIGRGVAQVKLVISNNAVGVISAVGNFTEAVIARVSC